MIFRKVKNIFPIKQSSNVGRIQVLQILKQVLQILKVAPPPDVKSRILNTY